MPSVDIGLDDLTKIALKRLVQQLLVSGDGEEKKILDSLTRKAKGMDMSKPEKNDLADLDDEMHGKPKTPKVTADDLPFDGEDELPDVPKKGRK